MEQVNGSKWFELKYYKGDTISNIPNNVISACLLWCTSVVLDIPAGNMTCLEIVCCSKLKEIKSLPPNLEYLYIRGAESLQKICEFPKSLRVLELSRINNPEFSIPKFPTSLTNLWVLSCPMLKELPDVPDRILQINIHDCFSLRDEIPQMPHIFDSQYSASRIKLFQSRQRQISKTKVIKEELMQVYCHPDRVEEWVNNDYDDW